MGYIEGIMISACINIVCVCRSGHTDRLYRSFLHGACLFSVPGSVRQVFSKILRGSVFYRTVRRWSCGRTVPALVIGIPTLRGKMSADCFTIATFGFGEATRVVMANVNHPYVGGALGFPGWNH